MTTSTAMSRRYLLAAGAGSFVVACGGAARAPSSAAGAAGSRDEMIRKYYAAWEKKDWAALEAVIADDFTFSSAAGDDHIRKSVYKAQCWDTQSALIERFDLESVIDNGSEGFVKYTCHTKKGKTFRNVEHFLFKGDKVAAVECYFGDTTGYPSAVNKGNG